MTEAREVRSRRRPWTDEEYGFVLHSRLTAKEIAAELGRTQGSVQQARWALRKGWTPQKEAGQPWTTSEDALIISNPNLSADGASRLLPGRTPSAISGRRQVLRGLRGDVPEFNRNTSPFKPGARPLLAKTCPACGLLLQEKWFEHDGRKRSCRVRECKRCRMEARNAKGYTRRDSESRQNGWADVHKRWQEITRERAERNGQPWLESDMEVLADPDMTLFQKALALRRTYAATQQAAHKFEFPSKTPALGDPERDQWLIANPNIDRIDEIRATISREYEPVSESAEVVAGDRRPDFEWDD